MKEFGYACMPVYAYVQKDFSPDIKELKSEVFL